VSSPARPTLVHYFDYKSPYAFIAQRATFDLARELDVALELIPYTLDIPSFLGSAALDTDGRDTVGTRTDHQWRRVRYAYMDCRREANRLGLTLRGPRKIFDSSIAHIGFLYAKENGDPRPYHDAVYERFWKHDIDIEDSDAIGAALADSGIDAAGFAGYLAGEGRRVHDDSQRAAEKRGVFGVPGYWVDGELFWGAERLARVRELLERA